MAPLLDVDGLLLLLAVEDGVRLDGHVAHRQQPDAPLGQASSLREGGGDLAERRALAQPGRASQLDGELAVAHPVPAGVHAERGELVAHRGRGGGRGVGQLREQPIEIGTGAKSCEGDVVAGVGDDRHLRPVVGVLQLVDEAADELGAGEPAGDHGDAHAHIVAARRSGR